MKVSSAKQKVLIENLLSDLDLFTVCSSIIKAEYFDPEFRQSVSFILDYYDKYSSLPTVDTIYGETELELIQRDPVPMDQFQYTTDSIATFCRERAVLREILNAQKLIEEQDYGTLVEKMTAAVQISLFSDLGTDVLSDVAERIEKRKEEHKYYSTGWPELDNQLGGGMRKTELLLLSAGSGGGKSIGMSNMALSFVDQGLDVLYISLELNEDMISDRFETMITKWDKKTKLSRIDETASIVEQYKHKNGATIIVKQMEGEKTNANDIRAYIKEYYLRFKKYPDALILDYLDVFETNQHRQYSNVHEKDKISSTQLRAIGNNVVHPMLMVTASQQNRSSVGETEMNHSHIAGGLSKISISDIYISIVMTDSMRAQGLATFALLKTRSSAGVGNTVHMIWDPVALTFTCSDQQVQAIPIEKPQLQFNADNKISELDDLLLN